MFESNSPDGSARARVFTGPDDTCLVEYFYPADVLVKIGNMPSEIEAKASAVAWSNTVRQLNG